MALKLWVLPATRVWGMGYDGPMGYGLKIPAYRTGGYKTLWIIRGYGLYGLWVKRGLTVLVIT